MNESQQPITVPAGAQSITITVGGTTPDLKQESDKTTPVSDSETEKSINQEAEKAEGDIEQLIPKGDYRNDPLFFEVAEYFGLKEEDYNGYKNHMAHIVDYVIRDIQTNDPTKVIPRIRQIEDSLQSPGWDEKRIANVHKYIRLASKKQVFTQMMKAYEK